MSIPCPYCRTPLYPDASDDGLATCHGCGSPVNVVKLQKRAALRRMLCNARPAVVGAKKAAVGR